MNDLIRRRTHLAYANNTSAPSNDISYL